MKEKQTWGRSVFAVLVFSFAAYLLTGCAQPIPDKTTMICPQPLLDNTGEYMCPYTQDGVLAEWTDNAINAAIGASVGQMAGAYAGQKALEMVPFVGGILGSVVGEQVGRAVALEMAGGEEFIIETSDVSFNNLNDMAVFLYVKYSDTEHYDSAIDATMKIYPDFEDVYMSALRNAPTY